MRGSLLSSKHHEADRNGTSDMTRRPRCMSYSTAHTRTASFLYLFLTVRLTPLFLVMCLSSSTGNLRSDTAVVFMKAWSKLSRSSDGYGIMLGVNTPGNAHLTLSLISTLAAGARTLADLQKILDHTHAPTSCISVEAVNQTGSIL